MCLASSSRLSRIPVRRRDGQVRISGIASRVIGVAAGSMIVVMVTVVHVVVMLVVVSMTVDPVGVVVTIGAVMIAVAVVAIYGIVETDVAMGAAMIGTVAAGSGMAEAVVVLTTAVIALTTVVATTGIRPAVGWDYTRPQPDLIGHGF